MFHKNALNIHVNKIHKELNGFLLSLWLIGVKSLKYPQLNGILFSSSILFLVRKFSWQEKFLEYGAYLQ